MRQAEYYLSGHGRMDWSDAHRLAGQMDALWMDFDGVQMHTFPSDPPQATHIWAWTTDRWLRVRVDGRNVIVGELSTTSSGVKAEIKVTANQYCPLSWSNKDRRIPTPTLHRLPARLSVIETLTLQPIQFIEASV